MTGDRLALAVRVRKARRASTCPACRGPVHVGQSIAKVTRPPGWIHTRCVEAVAAVISRQLTQDVPATEGGTAQEGTA